MHKCPCVYFACALPISVSCPAGGILAPKADLNTNFHLSLKLVRENPELYFLLLNLHVAVYALVIVCDFSFLQNFSSKFIYLTCDGKIKISFVCA